MRFISKILNDSEVLVQDTFFEREDKFTREELQRSIEETGKQVIGFNNRSFKSFKDANSVADSLTARAKLAGGFNSQFEYGIDNMSNGLTLYFSNATVERYKGREISLEFPSYLDFFECPNLVGVKLTKLAIEKGFVGFIGCCFYGADGLDKIVLPDTVSVVHPHCFSYMGDLKEVNLSADLDEVPERCFVNCNKLEVVTTSRKGGLSIIGAHAFAGCTALRTVEGITDETFVHQNAFANSNNLQVETLEAIRRSRLAKA